MNKIVKKHDSLAKKFLSDITVAKEFVKQHLPKIMLERCSLDSLEIEPCSFIDDSLSAYYADIVYRLDLDATAKDSPAETITAESLNIVAKDNKTTASSSKAKNNSKSKLDTIANNSLYIYCLIEHQSKAEELMSLRIATYTLGIIQRHVDKYKVKHKLPYVHCLLLYNGRTSPYPYSRRMSELFHETELYANQLLGDFNVLDLTIVDDKTILSHAPVIATLEMMQKHIRARDVMILAKRFAQVLQLLHEADINSYLLNSTFSYVFNGRGEADIKKIIAAIQKDAPYYEGDIMSYAETIHKQGMQQGMQQGRQEIIKKMLSKLSMEQIAELTGISIEDIKNIQ